MSAHELFPLIRVPAGWPVPVIATVAMVLLAALDLAGAVAAKEWAENGSLRYAELSVVTMGWIVILQVGLLLIDRWRYGIELPTGKWVEIGVVLLAQGYLLLAPTAGSSGRAAG